MIKKLYIYIIIVFALFFSFNLNGEAQSYIIKEANENDINSYCLQNNEQINFSCGELKKIENCEAVTVEIGRCDGTASDEYCIKTYIFVYEVGYFEFGHISSVYAGKGFNFPNISYKRNVYWDYYRDYEKIILLEARRGLKSNNINLSESEIDGYKVKLDLAASNALKEYLNTSSSAIIDIDIMANDSNKYEGEEKLNYVSGNWKKNYEMRKGYVIEEGESNAVIQEYTYNFCDSYINLSGSNFSNVEYKCGNVTLGNNYSGGYSKYYVPLLYPSNKDFHFNVVYSGEYLNINGTCEIDIVNELFDCDGNNCDPKYHYRPIDLSTPFPDGEVAANWKNYNNIIYNTRLKNTYDNGFYYRVVLVEDDSNSGEMSIDEIEDNNYNDWTNMKTDGTSNFVNNGKFKIPNEKSYCKIGFFETSCDVYRFGSDVS